MFKNKKNILLCFIAVFFMGFFLSILVMCNMGTDPYTFMNRSISKNIGWTFGNWQLLLNLILFAFVLVFARKNIGFGTIFNMVLIGYYVDFFTSIWKKLPEELWANALSRWIIFIIALFCFIISAAVYINSEVGVSPYDAMPLIITDLVKKKTGKEHRVIIRICYDFSAVIIGVLFGTMPVVGVVLMTIFLGPIIGVVGRFMKGEKKNSQVA